MVPYRMDSAGQGQEVAAESGLSWLLFLGIWGVMALASVIMLAMQVNWIVVAALMSLPTFLGIAWRPMFGLSLMCALMPFGQAISIKGVFSAEHGIGILFAVGSALNILATRKRLRLFNIPTLALFSLTLLAVLSITWATYAELAAQHVPTLAQMFIYIVLVITICREEQDLRWPLTVFVFSCVGALAMLMLAGRGIQEQEQRLTVVVGETVLNPNAFGVGLSLGFMTALYLFIKRSFGPWRWLYTISFVVLPMGVILSGSRKAVLFLAIAPVLPLLMSPWALRRLRVLFGLIFLGGLLAVTTYFTVEYLLPKSVLYRLTDVGYAAQSFWKRYSFIEDAIQYVSLHPLGAGLGNFRARSGIQVHNDFFFLFADLGFLGAAIFAAFASAMVFTAARMRAGIDKWYASAIVAFLLLIGTDGTWIFGKEYWLFTTVAWLVGTFQAQAAAGETRSLQLPSLDQAPAAAPLRASPSLGGG